MERYAIICPACAVTVARADDAALAEDIRKAAEHGDIDPGQEPYVADTWAAEPCRVGCVCEKCSAARERDQRDPRA